MIQSGLERLGTFRLLLGAEPRSGEQIGLRPDAKAVKAVLTGDLNGEPFTEETLRLVENLIRFLQKDSVLVRLHDAGFLHAKCFLFYADRPGQQGLFDRFRPVVAIVGSSNFTAPGLTSNRELNLAHKVLLDVAEVDDPHAEQAVSWLSDQAPSDRISPKNRQLIKSEVGARAIIELEQWYERQWQDGKEFKDELIALLDASKFGQLEYSPYQIYMKALYEYFKEDLDSPVSDMGRSAKVDILISTDVLSEGQNLQDCGYLINYDLHWNPTRMVQRAGRIDRIGTAFKTLWIYNMFPEEGLDRLLGLVQSLTDKISAIDRTGFLDASVLGETVHPRNFNTLRRIQEEDGTVIEEEEQFTELASNEFLLQQLRNLLSKDGKEGLDSLPDGIHSGLARERSKGMFFYFKARDPLGHGTLHFWRYYDLREKRIIDNRYLIASAIACNPDTPRVVDDYDVFGIQEKVIENILHTHQRRQALQTAPKIIDPIQQTVATAIQGYLQHPQVDRAQALDAIRYLNQPLPGVQVKELRIAYKAFQKNQVIHSLLEIVSSLKSRYGTTLGLNSDVKTKSLNREDLHLVCFDYLCS